MNRFKQSYYVAMVITLLALSACSKDSSHFEEYDEQEDEQEDNNEKTTTSFAPTSIIGKTFVQNRQSFHFTFASNGFCSVTDNVSSAGGYRVQGTPLYTYVRKNNTQSTIKVIFTEKNTFSSSSYILLNYTNTYTLTFTSKSTGTSSCVSSCKSVSYINGKNLGTDTYNNSSSNTFVLE